MRHVFISLVFILVILTLVDAASKRARKSKRRENSSVKGKLLFFISIFRSNILVFEFLDENMDGKIPVSQLKTRLEKILPLKNEKVGQICIDTFELSIQTFLVD